MLSGVDARSLSRPTRGAAVVARPLREDDFAFCVFGFYGMYVVSRVRIPSPETQSQTARHEHALLDMKYPTKRVSDGGCVVHGETSPAPRSKPGRWNVEAVMADADMVAGPSRVAVG